MKLEYSLKAKCSTDEEKEKFERLEAELNSKEYLQLREKKYSWRTASLIYDLVDSSEVRGKLEIKIPFMHRNTFNFMSEFVATLETEKYDRRDSELIGMVGWIVEGRHFFKKRS